jgi:hypothetical protein
MKLEVVVVPVADVDRAANFNKGLGWREDADAAHGQHEEDNGRADPEWPDRCARYMVDERTAQGTGA